MLPPASPETMLRDIAGLPRIRQIDPDFLLVRTHGHDRGLWAYWQIALAYAQALDPAFPWGQVVLPHSLPAQSPVMTDLPAGLSSAVLLQRPDVLQSEHQLKAANADIGAARAAVAP